MSPNLNLYINKRAHKSNHRKLGDAERVHMKELWHGQVEERDRKKAKADADDKAKKDKSLAFL